MSNSIDLGKVVGATGPGVPSGGTAGQVLVKNSDAPYDGKWETRPKSVNGVEAGADGDILIKKVQFADNLESDEAQQSSGDYIRRTTGGSASLSDGDAWLVRIHGNRVHTGYSAEVLNMTVTPAEREPGEYAITAELDKDTFRAYVDTDGTITLTYDGSDWSANPALYGVTITGTPIEDDEIKIVYAKEVRGTITPADPTAFASTGWNLYNHSDGYARVLKYSDTRGFLVGGTYTLLQYSETVDGTKIGITVTDGAFDIPGDGYVWVTGGDSTTTYILMTWSDWTSGYEGTWKAYAESTVSLSTIMSTYFPYGLLRVGAVADILDISMKQTISNIERMAYNATNLAIAEASGRDYEYDTNYIYLVRETPVVNAITVDGKHTASDHGMEIIKGTTVPVQVETLYGENLKEKLQHDIPQQITSLNQAIAQSVIGSSPIAIANGTDLNTIITPGYYVCAYNTTVATLSNCPVSIAFTMQVIRGTVDGNVIQILIEYYGGNTYKRIKHSTTWEQWNSLDDNLSHFITGQSLTSAELTTSTSILSYPNGVYGIGSVDTANFPFSYGTAFKIGIANGYGMIIAKRAQTKEMYVRHFNNTSWNDGAWYKYEGTAV